MVAGATPELTTETAVLYDYYLILMNLYRHWPRTAKKVNDDGITLY